MDIYKLKFTSLQYEILRFLFIKSGMTFNARTISKSLKVSPTAVGKSLQALQENGLVKVTKDKESKHLSIELNKDNPQVFNMKRVDNLKMIYESNLADFLYNSFPGTTIVLFGSYSYGEDTTKSDIDIAIIGSKTKEIDLTTFEKILERLLYANV
jgi:predicted nucleotidyltransferase